MEISLWEQWKQIRGEFKWWVITKVGCWVAAVWVTVMTIITTIWAWAKNLDGPYLLLFALCVLAACLAIAVLCVILANWLRQWWVFRQWERGARPLPSSSSHSPNTTYPEFYQNQAEMVQATGGGIVKELQEASRLWVSMIAGNQISLRDTEVLKKIDKLILVNPDSALMEILERVQPDRKKTFRSSIDAALGKFPKNNGKVKLSDTPVLNVVIVDPDEPHAWARLQLFLPYVSGEPSIGIKITKKDQLKAFETIKKSFLATWEGSQECH